MIGIASAEDHANACLNSHEGKRSAGIKERLGAASSNTVAQNAQHHAVSRARTVTIATSHRDITRRSTIQFRRMGKKSRTNAVTMGNRTANREEHISRALSLVAGAAPLSRSSAGFESGMSPFPNNLAIVSSGKHTSTFAFQMGLRATDR